MQTDDSGAGCGAVVRVCHDPSAERMARAARTWPTKWNTGGDGYRVTREDLVRELELLKAIAPNREMAAAVAEAVAKIKAG